jgi:hypothetical protein
VFAVRGSLPVDFEGAYVSHGNTLSWMSNNAKKMRPPPMGATAVAAPAPAPAPFHTTTADTFPALSSKAVATKQISQTAKFSYASAAATLSATASASAASASASASATGPPLPIKGTKATAEKGAKAEAEEIECWTLTSTREFGSANKVRSTIVW